MAPALPLDEVAPLPDDELVEALVDALLEAALVLEALEVALPPEPSPSSPQPPRARAATTAPQPDQERIVFMFTPRAHPIRAARGKIGRARP